jgi:hypothetical protein
MRYFGHFLLAFILLMVILSSGCATSSKKVGSYKSQRHGIGDTKWTRTKESIVTCLRNDFFWDKSSIKIPKPLEA